MNSSLGVSQAFVLTGSYSVLSSCEIKRWSRANVRQVLKMHVKTQRLCPITPTQHDTSSKPRPGRVLIFFSMLTRLKDVIDVEFYSLINNR